MSCEYDWSKKQTRYEPGPSFAATHGCVGTQYKPLLAGFATDYINSSGDTTRFYLSVYLYPYLDEYAMILVSILINIRSQ